MIRTLFPLVLLGLGTLSACGDKEATDTGTATDGDADTDTDADADTDTDADADTCEIDVCTKYGAAVPIAAGAITDAAVEDPLFAEDFAPLLAEGPAAVDAFKASLSNFITDAYGCTTGVYDGPTMEAAHAGMDITQAEYDAFVTLIAGELLTLGVTEDEVTYCFAPTLTDPAFANTIIGQ